MNDPPDRDPRAVAAKPDMTPMIDVVFLMIIFFLCIEFRVLEAKLPAFLPRDRGGSTTVCEVEQLTVRVFTTEPGERRWQDRPGEGRYRLEGHRVAWQVGPRTVASQEELAEELRRIAASPGSRVPDPATGRPELLPCVVDPDRGVCYADVTRTTDLARAAGFENIQFGGGRR